MTLIIPSRRVSLPACCVLLMVTIASCGKSGPPRYELNGTITYLGKAVPAGEIRFEPIGSVVNSVSIGVAAIKDGKFSTIVDKGTVGGRQRLFISGYNGVPEPGSGPDGASIFEMYVVEVDLPAEASTFDVEVPKSVQQLRKF